MNVVVRGPEESERVAAVQALQVLDTPPEERFDRIARVAAAAFRVPIAAVSLIDADRQWAKACVGLSALEVPRTESFCSVTIQSDESLVVPDTCEDPRFAQLGAVTGYPFLRFYAGHPIHSQGFRVGTLCIVDLAPRTLDADELARLADLAALAEDELSRTDLAVALGSQRDSEQQIRAVMDNVGEGIVTFGEDGVVRSANPGAEAAFGAERGGLEGVPVDAIVRGIPWARARDMLPQLLGHRRLVTGRRLDGTEFPLEYIISDAVVAGRRMLIGIGRDVSALEEAAAALRVSEKRFRAVFDYAAIGIVLVDRAGRVADANPAFAELLDRPLDEVCGLRLYDFMHEEARSDSDVYEELFAGTRDTYRRERRLLRADGTEVWGAVTVSVMDDAEGRPQYAVGMIEDISQRKEVERLKDEFMSVVGHELRTPLTSIRGSLGLLDGGLVGDLGEEARDMVRLALDNTNRLVRLVEDTLDLERMQAGATELELRPVAATDLIAAAVSVVDRLRADAGLELRVETEPLEVLADSDRIVQALTNLIGNAVKFSPPGGTITLGVRRRGRDAEFRVADEGRGIPADKLEAIFERFRQVDASDRREKGGTGLGLAIAREIVLNSNGRIWVESELGRGSTFLFTLPLVEALTTVAVLDRRVEGREALATMLAELGVRAVPVAGATELAAAAEREAVAAVILAVGPATADALAALDADPATAPLPKVLMEGPDDSGLLAALADSVPALRPGRVLVVEDDPDLGRLLVAELEHLGLVVELARTGREARAAVERAAPGLVVLDLVLPGEDGFAIVDWLRRAGRLAQLPLLVYSGRTLGADDRERLQLGRTEFLAKASVPPAEVSRRVAELLGCIAGNEHEEEAER